LEGGKGSASFLKKRSKKLLRVCMVLVVNNQANNQKFFGSFFQKRTAFFTLLYFPQPHPGAANTEPPHEHPGG
jgi:hypothetical protein